MLKVVKAGCLNENKLSQCYNMDFSQFFNEIDRYFKTAIFLKFHWGPRLSKDLKTENLNNESSLTN